MAWITPSTWVTGQQVTKSQFAAWNNTLASVGDHGGWSTWSITGPNWPNQPPAVTVRGRKLRVGDIAYVSFYSACSSTANSPPTGAPILLAPPYTAAAGSTDKVCGWAYLYDAVGDNTYLLTAVTYTAQYVGFRLTHNGSSTNLPWWSQGAVDVPNISDYTGARVAGMLIYRAT